MTELKFEPNYSVHPGEIINDAINDKNISPESLSTFTGIKIENIKDILLGDKQINENEAIMFEEFLGIKSSLLLNLQEQHDKSKKPKTFKGYLFIKTNINFENTEDTYFPLFKDEKSLVLFADKYSKKELETGYIIDEKAFFNSFIDKNIKPIHNIKLCKDGGLSFDIIDIFDFVEPS